jgi:hypothetical protein
MAPETTGFHPVKPTTLLTQNVIGKEELEVEKQVQAKSGTAIQSVCMAVPV